MQAVQQKLAEIGKEVAPISWGSLSPAAMAKHLHRSTGVDAPCFARAMQEYAAWANESWGMFWAEVVQEI